MTIGRQKMKIGRATLRDLQASVSPMVHNWGTLQSEERYELLALATCQVQAIFVACLSLLIGRAIESFVNACFYLVVAIDPSN